MVDGMRLSTPRDHKSWLIVNHEQTNGEVIGDGFPVLKHRHLIGIDLTMVRLSDRVGVNPIRREFRVGGGVSAVDAEHHLIVTHEVTSIDSD